MRPLFAAIALATAFAAQAQEFITVASTTSTEQSGLFRHLPVVTAILAGMLLLKTVIVMLAGCDRTSTTVYDQDMCCVQDTAAR